MESNISNPLKKVGEYVLMESELLGKGSYGVVYKGYHQLNPKDFVAIKQINLQRIPEQQLEIFKEMVEKEVNCLLGLNHPNIIKLYEVKLTRNNLYLITELCPNGDFRKKIGNLPLTDILVYFKIIMKAMLFAKQKKLIHRDIKPENILLKGTEAKIADFGFSRFVDDPDAKCQLTNRIGTPLYMAPEVFHAEKYSSKCDVWSSGVMLYQMIYGLPPWTGFSAPNLFNNIKEQPLSFPNRREGDKKMVDLLKKMLELNQDKRLDFEGVLAHEAFSFDLKEEETKEDNDEKPNKYIDYLIKLASFCETLVDDINDNRKALGLSRQTSKELSLLLKKISIMTYYKIERTSKGKNKDYKSGVLPCKEKYSALYKEKKEDFIDESESTEKLSDEFINEVINGSLSEVSKDFKKEYSIVFQKAIDQMNEKTEKWKEMGNEHIMKIALKILKINKYRNFNKLFDFDENDEDPFQKLEEKIEAIGKKKLFNKVSQLMESCISNE